MKKSLIAGAGVAALAMAAVPFAGVFADPQATDTIEVTVNSSCTFTTGAGTATYSASGNNGASVNPQSGSSNVHDFTVFCNDNDGYKVSATANALNQSPAITANFAYAATLPSGADGAWNAAIGQAQGGSLVLEQLPSGGAATDIVSHTGASVTGGESFTATYTAYIGTATPTGTYSGTIAYTLAAN